MVGRLDLVVLAALLSSCCFAFPQHGKIDGEKDEIEHQLRIVNGENADAGEFPFVGVIESATTYSEGQVDGLNQCGGSIISDRVILTAAHCVVKDTPIMDSKKNMVDQIYLPQHITVKVGETHLYNEEGTEQQRKVAGIIVHEDYNGMNV